ncbi:MAG: 16S rRNA processing protein RimM [Flavobacteriaceae bacterium]|jgi:16S rRNA processing protein RimM|nr:16S rRNA processing protein RimM [Flavobacteriaceae bacterium]OUV86041.1 MAG: 16S rRNA processing protein RimM [Flavobacteriaceae bacterium TMED145]|tara:strand:+ start:132 stop:656 length:525 start_codon:yes stop_codon:yes gene_type:complete
MNQSKFFYLGKITRKFSFKGELIIFLDTDSPLTYYDLKKVYVKEDDSYLPYFISEISKYKNNSVRVKFEDIENESMASNLINKEIFLPINELPKLDGKRFYYHEVNGFQVEDITHGKIGEIEYINDQTPQHLFVINSNDKEVLIPINDDFILELDRINKTIKMDLPEGLLKIYI